MISMIDAMAFARHRSGTVAATAAIAGFAIGAAGAFVALRAAPPGPILLRQAVESAPGSAYQPTEGATGMLVLLRNDSATPVQVSSAAFSRASAAPPLYIAPDTLQPGEEVDVYVPVPGSCFAGLAPGTSTAIVVAGPSAAPVQIMVSARLADGPIQSVPVEVGGDVAAVLNACQHGGR